MQPSSSVLDGDVRPLAACEFEQIRRLAYDTFGLDLKPGKQELVSARLRRLVRAHGLRSYADYCQHVRQDRTGESLAAMIDALTTNHTAFMREPEHFRFLREEVVPQLAGRRRIDIWSAACSTGEEVWSLVFLLADALPQCEVHLVGSDISNKVLEKARQGWYAAERMVGLPAEWYRRYLVRGEGEWQGGYRVAERYRSRAEFQRLNLIGPIRWPRPFPIVFCRNVMIYFDKPTQEKVVQSLTNWLEPGGWLFVGHAESLVGGKHALDYVRPAVYRRPGQFRRI
jgi:chemotaxis protein methyltransferase CheR